MINITDWIAVIPPEDKRLAYVGEHESVMRQFFLPDLTYRDHAFYLDMEFDLSTVTHRFLPKTVQKTEHTSSEQVDADGITVTATSSTTKENYSQEGFTVDSDVQADIAALAKTVREDGILLTWTVLGQQTQLPGVLRATLRAVGPTGDVKKSAMMSFTVSPSVEATPASPVALSEHEQMERAMVLALEQAAADTYAAFEKEFNEAVGSVEQIKGYIDEKTAPATKDAYGTVKLGNAISTNVTTPEGTVFKRGTGLALNDDGELSLFPASKAEIQDPSKYNCAPITAWNLDYAVKYIGDGYYAREGDVDEIKKTLEQKIAPATGESYGTVKCHTDNLVASIVNGIYIDDNGLLTFVPASNSAIDSRSNPYCPIVPANLEYAVKSIGDGYYAKAGEAGAVAGKKVYERIAAITVTATEDGKLPTNIVFTVDGDGNPFELTDFYIHMHAGFTDGNKSSLYMKVSGKSTPVIANASIGFISTPRSSTVFFRHDATDGVLTVTATESMVANAVWNSQSSTKKQVMIPPLEAEQFLPVTQIDLYTSLGDNKTWVEGSTFELWGVRK